MDFGEFIQIVRREAGLDVDAAERAARATLTTLAERLHAGEARDLLDELPEEMEPWLTIERAAERFEVGEFLRRVAEREGVDVEVADRHARSVFFALGRALNADRIAGVAAGLTRDFDPFVREVERCSFEVMPAEEFRARVGERTGLTLASADLAVEAVLEGFAECIAGGDVDALIRLLSPELHGPLRRGGNGGGTAPRMTLERFLERTAVREGVDRSEATEHARAVFATLREAVGEKEFFDVTDRLFPEYAALLSST